MLTTILLAAVLTATPAPAEIIQRDNGDICYTVMYGDRTISGMIRGLPPGADPEVKGQIHQFYVSQAVQLLTAGAGSMSVEGRIGGRITCPDCGGHGGSRWYPGKWDSIYNFCEICKGMNCNVTCWEFGEPGTCPPPCR